MIVTCTKLLVKTVKGQLVTYNIQNMKVNIITKTNSL